MSDFITKRNYKLYFKRAILLFLILTNCIVIFNFSAQKADESSNTSGKVVDKIIEKVYKRKQINKSEELTIRDKITTIVRKGAHFSIYTCLGILTYLYMSTYSIKKKKRLLYTIIFCLMYACSDEIHQKFVEGRSCELRDVCIDTCGAIFGSTIVIGVSKLVEVILYNNKKMHNKA